MHSSEVHRQYEVLTESLHLLAQSERNQLFLIDRWMEEVLRWNGDPRYRSYVREILSHLISLVPNVQPLGCHPDFFASLRRHTSQLASHYRDVTREEEILPCLERLRRKELTLHAYLGQPWAMDETAPQLPTAHARELTVLDEWIARLPHAQATHRQELQDIASHWRESIVSHANCTRVPLLEFDVTDGRIELVEPFGLVANLKVYALDEHEGNEDAISFPQLLDHAQSLPVEVELRNAVAAARALAKEVLEGNVPSALSVSFTFENSRIHYAGRSLGLGSAVAFLSLLSNRMPGRNQFLSVGETVFTGLIAPDGAILPIDEKQVRLKVRTLFFSPYKRLVIAHENTQAAIETRDELLQEFPNRSLEIHSIGHLREAAEHRKIIHIKPYTFSQRTVRFARRHKAGLITSSAAFIVLAVIGYLLLLVDWDRNPDHVTVDGNFYLIQNRNGKNLWSKEINDPSRPMTTEWFRGFHEPGSLWIVRDIDRDDSNEVVLRHLHGEGLANRIDCLNNDGTMLWTRTISKGIKTLEGSYLTEEGFQVTTMALVPGDSVRHDRIVASAINTFYTNVVRLFDQDGNTISEYLHLGALETMRVIRGQNGKQWILIAGTHNGYRQSSIVVLDPDYIDGVSPQRASHRLLIPQLPAAREVYHIHFPTPDVEMKNPDKKISRSYLGVVDSTYFTVQVQHGTGPKLTDKDEPYLISLVYTFDLRTMRATTVNTSTAYDRMHEFMKGLGLISSTLDEKYKQNLIDNIEYWNGDEYVKTPTMNRKYVEVVRLQ